MAYTPIWGALSRAIGDSFQGLTSGGLAGEDVRHKRAQEGLQQEYLKLALGQQAQTAGYQQSLIDWRRQQALIADRRAQEQAARDENLMHYQQGLLRLGEARDIRERDLADIRDRRERELKGEALAEKKAKDEADAANKVERTRIYGSMARTAQQRADQIGQRLHEMITKPTTQYTLADKAYLRELDLRYREASTLMSKVAQFQLSGQLIEGFPTMQQLRAEMDGISQEMAAFAAAKAQGASGGKPAGGGNAPFANADEARRALGLQ